MDSSKRFFNVEIPICSEWTLGQLVFVKDNPQVTLKLQSPATNVVDTGRFAQVHWDLNTGEISTQDSRAAREFGVDLSADQKACLKTLINNYFQRIDWEVVSIPA